MRLFFSSLLVLLGSSFILQTQPVNNECFGALDISDQFVNSAATACQVFVSGPYNNTEATVEASDYELTGYQGNESDAEGICCLCEDQGTLPYEILELDATLWFVFIPPQSGNYRIDAIAQGSLNGCGATLGSNEDTQMLIYESTTGDCSSLTFKYCNEDGPLSTTFSYPAGGTFDLIGGLTYYMVIDEYGPAQRGEFCIEVALDSGDCDACNDDYCAQYFGENVCDCFQDCPCQVSLIWADFISSVFVDEPVGHCASDIGSESYAEPLLFLPFTIETNSEKCLDNSGDDFGMLELSLGRLFYAGADIQENSSGEIDGWLFMIGLTKQDIDQGSLIMSFVGNQGLGCEAVFEVDISHFSDPGEVCQPTGLNANLPEDWRLFVNGGAEIVFSGLYPITTQLRIFDLNGRLMDSARLENETEINIKVGSYPSGLYLIQIENNRQVFTKKLHILN